MCDPARRRATYQAVLDAPENVVAEILDGERTLMPRPGKPHAAAATDEGSRPVRAEPFDAIELDLGVLWADVELG